LVSIKELIYKLTSFTDKNKEFLQINKIMLDCLPFNQEPEYQSYKQLTSLLNSDISKITHFGNRICLLPHIKRWRNTYSAWFHRKSYSKRSHFNLRTETNPVSETYYFLGINHGVIPELVILNVFLTEWNKKLVPHIQIVCKMYVCGYELGSHTSMYLRGSGQVQKLKVVHITFCLAASAEQSHRAVAPTLKFPGWKNTTTGHFSAGTGPANSQVKTYVDAAQLHLTAEKIESCIPQLLFSSFFSQNKLKSFAQNFPVSACCRSK